MDELLSFSGTACFPVLEFEVCEVPEQWLLMGDHALDEDATAAWASHSVMSSDMSRNPPAVADERKTNRRGRKPRPRTGGSVPPISHTEAERQRREKLNSRFCDLRAAVPTVSRMDKASLLADAAAYIAELRRRVERLEADAAALKKPPSAAAAGLGDDLEVRMIGRDAAALRLTTNGHHAPARMMCALRALNLPVQHASVTRVGGATVQDVMVDDVPAALQDEGCLRTALLHRLELMMME